LRGTLLAGVFNQRERMAWRIRVDQLNLLFGEDSYGEAPNTLQCRDFLLAGDLITHERRIPRSGLFSRVFPE
jgi:hypothetical protein